MLQTQGISGKSTVELRSPLMIVCPIFEQIIVNLSIHLWELMVLVGDNGSYSLPFMMKVMVCDLHS